MENFIGKGLDASKVLSGYRDTEELIRDELAVLEHRLYLFYKYHQWVGPKNNYRNMLGLVVTREEFEHNVSEASSMPLEARLTPEERKELETDAAVIRARIRRTDRERNRLLQLIDRFDLGRFELNSLMLALAPLIEEKYEKLYAYLQDDITKKVPTINLAASLFMEEDTEGWEYAFRFHEEKSFSSLFSQEELEDGKLVPLPEVMGFLSGRPLTDGNTEFYDPGTEEPEPLLIHVEEAEKLSHFMELEKGIAILSGAKGSGRRFQIKTALKKAGLSCILVDIPDASSRKNEIMRGAMLARLMGSALAISGFEMQNEDGEIADTEPVTERALLDAVPPCGFLFLIAQKPVHLATELPVLELSFGLPDISERLRLFRYFFRKIPLSDDFSFPAQAARFHFQPAQIRQAADELRGLSLVERREMTDRDVSSCCYHQAVHKLDQLAHRLSPSFTWDDIILPDSLKRILVQACAHVRYNHQVYDEWGYGKRIPYGRGLSILFDGPPGTGKTMCARIMAGELNMEMYKINISQIVSKYVGETEKNLQAVFAEAKKADCILFFDECDSLFGKRSDVKDAQDRNANVETAYLLQQIEEYDGVCILATNLLKNIDEAFLRRITYVLHFPFPDADARERIYKSMITDQTPIGSDLDIRFMAENFELSGGYIKNIVLSAVFRAAREREPLGMRHLLNAAVNEMRKNEMVVVRERLKEYQDLLDE